DGHVTGVQTCALPIFAVARPARSRRAVARAAIRLLPGLATAIVLFVVGVASGGYFPRTWRLGTIALVALAGAALLGRKRIAFARRDWAFLALFAALTAWTALSARWSGQRATSLLEGERDVV